MFAKFCLKKKIKINKKGDKFHKKSKKLSFDNNISLLLDYDFFLFVFIVLFFGMFLQFEEKLFGFFKIFFSACLYLRSFLFFLLFVLFLNFLFIMLSSSFSGTKHSLQILVTLILIEYNSSMSLTSMMIMMLFIFVNVEIFLLNFGHFDKVVYKSVILIIGLKNSYND